MWRFIGKENKEGKQQKNIYYTRPRESHKPYRYKVFHFLYVFCEKREFHTAIVSGMQSRKLYDRTVL